MLYTLKSFVFQIVKEIYSANVSISIIKSRRKCHEIKINMLLSKVNSICSYRRDVEEHLPLKASGNHVVLTDGQMVHRYV